MWGGPVYVDKIRVPTLDVLGSVVHVKPYSVPDVDGPCLFVIDLSLPVDSGPVRSKTYVLPPSVLGREKWPDIYSL